MAARRKNSRFSRELVWSGEPMVATRSKASDALTLDDARRIALSLPRAYEVVVRGRVKFRVGSLVFLAFSTDETIMGFGFPKELRQAIVEAEPEKFLMPAKGDLRYNWVEARFAAIGEAELRTIIIESWRMCVPKSVGSSVG